MRIDIITIFPEAFAPLDLSIIGRAKTGGQVQIFVHNLRDFTFDKHRKVDDKPFGGGVGMVMMVEPFAKAVRQAKETNPKAKTILLSPAGAVFNQQMARELSREEGLVLLCGHYEGIDERVTSLCDREISIGDYVLTGGEFAALVLIDATTRLLPGVLPPGAAEEDSFSANILDWTHYTRPADWHGQKAPEVLLSGDHKLIEAWRRKTAEERTRKQRPDLWETYLKEDKIKAQT